MATCTLLTLSTSTPTLYDEPLVGDVATKCNIPQPALNATLKLEALFIPNQLAAPATVVNLRLVTRPSYPCRLSIIPVGDADFFTRQPNYVIFAKSDVPDILSSLSLIKAETKDGPSLSVISSLSLKNNLAYLLATTANKLDVSKFLNPNESIPLKQAAAGAGAVKAALTPTENIANALELNSPLLRSNVRLPSTAGVSCALNAAQPLITGVVSLSSNGVTLALANTPSPGLDSNAQITQASLSYALSVDKAGLSLRTALLPRGSIANGLRIDSLFLFENNELFPKGLPLALAATGRLSLTTVLPVSEAVSQKLQANQAVLDISKRLINSANLEFKLQANSPVGNIKAALTPNGSLSLALGFSPTPVLDIEGALSVTSPIRFALNKDGVFALNLLQNLPSSPVPQKLKINDVNKLEVGLRTNTVALAANYKTPLQISLSAALSPLAVEHELNAPNARIETALRSAPIQTVLAYSAGAGSFDILNTLFVKPRVNLALAVRGKSIQEVTLVAETPFSALPISSALGVTPAPFLRKIVEFVPDAQLALVQSVSDASITTESILDDGPLSLTAACGLTALSSELSVIKTLQTSLTYDYRLDLPTIAAEIGISQGFIVLKGDELGSAAASYKLTTDIAIRPRLSIIIALASDVIEKKVFANSALTATGALELSLQAYSANFKLSSSDTAVLAARTNLQPISAVGYLLATSTSEIYGDKILAPELIELKAFTYAVPSLALIRPLSALSAASALDTYGINSTVEPDLTYLEQDIDLGSAVAGCRLIATGLIFTPSSTELPARSQELVKYPLPTGSSFATPVTVEGDPIYMSHSVFGGAVFTVDATQGSGEFSFRFNAAVAAAASEYNSNMPAVSNVLLMRISHADTSLVKRSLSGIDLIGPNVQKSVSYSQLSQATGQLLTSLTGTGSGTDLAVMPLAEAAAFNPVSPTGKRLLFASSNIRHNYSAGQPITEPTAIASDVVVGGKKYLPSRVESTVGAYIDDLSAVYSTSHFGIVPDSSVQLQNNTALMSASLMAQDGATVGSIHSSDSTFAFMPIKAGLKTYSDSRKIRRDGVYRVSTAVFDPVDASSYVVELIDASTLNTVDIRTVLEPNDKAALRLKVQNYKGQQGRTVTVDVPVLDVGDDLAGSLAVDSSYRWFFDQIKSGGQFNADSFVYLLVEEPSGFVAGTTELFVTRPVVNISGDQGESLENLFSTPGNRNVILGEFSLSLTKPDIDASADVRVAQGSASTVLYAGSTSPASYTSTFNPRGLNIVVKTDGTLVATKDTVQVGLNAVLPKAVLDFIAAGGRFSKVKIGENVTGLLTVPQSGTTQRRLYLWGSNAYGHLDVPTAVAPSFSTTWYVPNVREFDIATAYVTIINDDGLLKSWGCVRSTSWLPANTTAPVSAPVKEMAIGDKVSVAKTDADVVVSFGAYTAPSGQTWSPGSSKTLAAGERHLAAITSAGTVVCWGDNSLGQCNVPIGLSDVVEIEAGHNHTVARQVDGTVVCWGDNGLGQCTVPSGLNAKAVSAGGNFTAAIRSLSATDVVAGPSADYVEDTVACWGANDRGQCNVPLTEGISYDPTSTKYRMRFKQISCGWDHVVATRSDSDPVKAQRDHPELTRFHNMGLAKFPLKTSGNATIYADFHQLELCVDPAANCTNPNLGQYALNQFVKFVSRTGTSYTLTSDGTGNWFSNGITVGVQQYRLYSNDPYVPGFEALQVQKLVTGTWTTLYFQRTDVATNDTAFWEADAEFVSYSSNVVKYHALWDGHKTGSLVLPSWKVGYKSSDVSTEPNIVSYMGAAYLDSSGTTLSGEYVSVDLAALDVLGLVGYDNRVVYWGNPMAYDIAYRKDDYVQYGIDAETVEDYATVSRAGYAYKQPYEVGTTETTSYVGFGAGLADFDSNNYWFYETASARMYLGSHSLIEVPDNQRYKYLFAQDRLLPVGTTAVYFNNTTYWNRPLPVATGPNSIYLYSTPSGISETGGPDGYPDDKPSAGFLNNCVVVRSTATLPSGATIVNDAQSPSGKFITWTGVIGGSAITINLTAIYATYSSANSTYEVYAPFDPVYRDQPISALALSVIGLSVKFVYAVRHMSDRVLQPNQQIKAGKHISWIRNDPSAGISSFSYDALGLTQRSTDLLTVDRTLYDFSAHNAFFGYRTYVSLVLSGFQTYNTTGDFYRLLYASYGGVNTGHLDISKEFKLGSSKFSGYDVGYLYPPNYFMNLQQTLVPAPATGRQFMDVSCSQFHSVALDNEGSVYAWGSNYGVEPVRDYTGPWTPTLWHYWPDQPRPEELTPLPTAGLGLSGYFTSAAGANILANTVAYNSYGPGLVDRGTDKAFYYPDVPSIPGENNVSSWDTSGVFLSTDTSLSKPLLFQPYESLNAQQPQVFSLSLDVSGSVKRLKISTNTIGDDKYSDPLPANARFISAGWDYSSSGMVMTARVNGTPVTWNGGAPDSGVFSKINLKSCIGVFGGGSSYDQLRSGVHVRNVADRTVKKLFAGDYVSGLLLENETDSTRSDIVVRSATSAPAVGSIAEPVFDVTASNNQYVASVKRTYETIDVGSAAPIAGTIYAGSNIGIIRYNKASPNFKIAYSANLTSENHQVDFNSTSLFFPGMVLWPRVVLPAQYAAEQNAGTPLISPENLYVTKLPRFTYTADQYSLLSTDPTYSNVEFADYTPAKYVPVVGSTELSEYVFYDQTTGKLLPQSVVSNILPPGANVVKFAAGSNFAYALRTDSKLTGWGRHGTGVQNSISHDPSANYTDVVVHANLVAAIRSGSGSVDVWGAPLSYERRGTLHDPSGNLITGVKKVAVHPGCIAYIDSQDKLKLLATDLIDANGVVITRQLDPFSPEGQYENPYPNDSFTDIKSGNLCFVGLRANGSVVAWGYNSSVVFGETTQPGQSYPAGLIPAATETGFVQIAVGFGHAAARKANGNIVIWGNMYTAARLNTISGSIVYSDIACGREHVYAIRQSNSRIHGITVSDGNDAYLNTYGEISFPANQTALRLAQTGAFATNSVYVDSGSILRALGGGEQGEGGEYDYGQSVVPYASLLTEATFNPTASGVQNFKNVVSSLAPPASIEAMASGFYDAGALATKKHALSIASGLNYCVAVQGDTYASTQGSLVAWGTSIGTLPTGSNFVKVACRNRHAVALRADGSAITWGANTNGQVPGNISGTYSDAVCTDTSTILLNTNGLVVCYGQITSPGPYQNVQFDKIAAGANHVIGIVKVQAVVFISGQVVVLDAGQTVCWGDNANGQATPPGYGVPAYGAPRTAHVAAGLNFSSYYRNPQGFFVDTAATSIGFINRPSDTLSTLLEGYTVFAEDRVCEGLLPADHPFLFDVPRYRKDPATVGINFDGYKRNLSWLTNATSVPAAYTPSGTGVVKRIGSGRLRHVVRTGGSFDSSYDFGVGYGVLVDANNSIVVWGGEQTRSGTCQLPPTDASIALRTIPANAIASDESVISIDTALGYVYILKDNGAVVSWGYNPTNEPGYFQIPSGLKQMLSVPTISTLDELPSYNNGGNIGLTYVSGLPNQSTAWSIDVYVDRVFNGEITNLRRLTAVGDVRVRSLTQPVHFAQTFIASDVWPGEATDLDSYYRMYIVGRGLTYKINTATMFAMNVDSRLTPAQRTLVDGDAPGLGQADVFFRTSSGTAAFTGAAQLDSNIAITSIQESETGIRLGYTGTAQYPGYLVVQSGQTAEIEAIESSGAMVVAGRIANLQSRALIDVQGIYSWFDSTSLPAVGTSSVSSWANSISGFPALARGSVSDPFCVLIGASKGLSLDRRLAPPPAPDFLFASHPNIAIGEFTYFLVAHKAANSIASPYMSFGASAVSAGNVPARIQGLGYSAGIPGVFFFDPTLQQTRYVPGTTAVAVSSKHIVTGYFGGATAVSIRVNGVQQTLGTSSEVTVTLGGAVEATTGFNLGTAVANNNYHDADDTYIEVIAFNRKLTDLEILFVERFLADKHTITLPPEHPLNAPSDKSFCVSYPGFTGFHSEVIESSRGATSNGLKQTWLALFDYGVTYTGARTADQEHAPLLADVEIGLNTSTSLLARPVVGSLNATCTVGGFDTVPSFVLIPNRITCSAAVSSADMSADDVMSPKIVAGKLAYSATLAINRNLPAAQASSQLGFLGGINCDTPYGCTDVGTEPPLLSVIQPGLGALPITMQLAQSTASLGGLRQLRLIDPVKLTQSIVAPKLAGSVILHSFDARVNRFIMPAFKLKAGPANLGYSTSGLVPFNVPMQSNVSICDYSKFIVTNPTKDIDSPKNPFKP